MPTFMYDAIHNSVRRVEDDDDAVDERGLIKDGKRVRVGLMMMDHNSVQYSVALEDARRKCEEERALYQLDVSNRWRGGVCNLQPGDVVTVGNQQGVVTSHDDGGLVIQDASKLDGETLKQHAYDAYDAEIQSRYLTTRDAVAGDNCTTAGRQSGKWREKAGRLVCVPDDKSSKEFALAGPLSDEERVKVRDEMYTQYDRSISEAWRK